MKYNMFNKGISGYSPKGSYGKKGSEGNTVFYSSISSTVDIQNRIDNNRSLSNNPNENEPENSYKTNDIIVLPNSSVYIIDGSCNIQKIGNIVNTPSMNITENNKYFDVSVGGNPVDSSNNYGYDEDNTYSPFYHHRYNKKENIYKIRIDTSVNNVSTYKFGITYNSGITEERICNEDASVFVEPLNIYMIGKAGDASVWGDSYNLTEEQEMEENDGAIKAINALQGAGYKNFHTYFEYIGDNNVVYRKNGNIK